MDTTSTTSNARKEKAELAKIQKASFPTLRFLQEVAYIHHFLDEYGFRYVPMSRQEMDEHPLVSRLKDSPHVSPTHPSWVAWHYFRRTVKPRVTNRRDSEAERQVSQSLVTKLTEFNAHGILVATDQYVHPEFKLDMDVTPQSYVGSRLHLRCNHAEPATGSTQFNVSNHYALPTERGHERGVLVGYGSVYYHPPV